MNKRLISVFFTLFVILALGLSAQTTYPQKLSIDKNSLIDEAKNKVLLRGFSIRDPVASLYGDEVFKNECIPMNAKLFSTLKESGASIIRLPILPYSWRKVGKANTFKAIDQSIDYASKNEMYLMIAFQATGWPSTENPSDKWGRTTAEEMLQFWNEISKRYSGSKTIAIYDLFSEPVTKEFMKLTESNWIEWSEIMGQVIDLIQKNDPDAICLVSGIPWGYDISYAVRYPIERKNVGYAVHPFPADSELSTIRNIKMMTTVAKKHFVFATEMGYSIEGFVALENVEKKLVDLNYELKTKIDDVNRNSGNQMVVAEMRKKMVADIFENEKTSKAMSEVIERYQKELKTAIDSYNISWCAWSYSSSKSWVPCLLENKKRELTDSGKFFMKWMAEPIKINVLKEEPKVEKAPHPTPKAKAKSSEKPAKPVEVKDDAQKDAKDEVKMVPAPAPDNNSRQD